MSRAVRLDEVPTQQTAPIPPAEGSGRVRTRRGRWLTAGLATLAAALLPATPAAADPPGITTEFDLAIPFSCPGSDDAIVAYLHFERSVRVLPDATEHYFLDVRGTLVNEDTGTTATVHVVRRFTDDIAADTTQFSGLQNKVSAPGEGVLHLNAGRMLTGYTDPFAIVAQHGRWDGYGAELSPEVCRYMTG
ncbi:hypothetical protein JD79_00374 [Geodermatophilus normandii]|uniref:Uncharacterized protein n=1 Tax=Geodermatophilus normandii TaxID=1137989 RepID=A0A317QF68_9ACTN|nr:hypothetical protein [Geodermatophilus normandii]PWW21246.1 hypothetical protein JD79_00374 [Geodermatophilus normandii]